jgi:hypothetical protein
MLNKRFLKFRYTAIRRYGEKKWSAQDGVVEFNPNYTVSVSTCEKNGFSNGAQKAYIVELSNGTKFLAFLRGFGYAQVETILSEEGEQANIEADQQKNAQLTKMLLHKLN